MNVAVTGVGGLIGQSIIKSLQGTDYNAIGVNSEELGAGLYATERSYLGFYANDKEFIRRTAEICRAERCSILFPGLDAELIPLSDHIHFLKTNGICPIVSRPEVIEICNDKLQTCIFLRNHGFPFLHTYDLRSYASELDFPVVLKPKKGGSGSIGVFVIENERQFNFFRETLDIDNYVIQEYVEGEEYTCGTITLAGKCIGVIVMKRQLRGGDTYKAFVVRNSALENFVSKIVLALKPFGACNIQLRIKNGVPYVFEINARCSGTTAARTLAGFNEPKIICDFISKGIDNPTFTIKEIAVLRYWKELAVSYDQIREMKSSHFGVNHSAKL